MSFNAFVPQASPVAVAVTTTLSAPILTVPLNLATGGGSYRVYNGGAAAVAFALYANQANATASPFVFPVAGNQPQTGVMVVVINPGNTEVFNGPAGAWVRAITGTGTSTLYVQTGEGV
jgi:hypothetical protein